MSAFGLVLVISLALTLVEGYQSFRSRIPNGDRVRVNGAPWDGVGHRNRGGGGALNGFGSDFRIAGFRWTPLLCQTDSDGDGRTNGQELGDPSCTWREGRPAPSGRPITHPGIVG